MKSLIALLLCLPLVSLSQAQIPRTPAPENARVYFITPQNGEVLSGPVTVRFGLEQMGIAPAGAFKDASTMAQWPNTGHHHLIIDGELPPLDQPIPANDTYHHFGTGATQVTLTLAPGDHTLQLLMGDAMHIPHNPAVTSEKITIHVK
jgi:Domain of unknown function (DUF4399)